MTGAAKDAIDEARDRGVRGRAREGEDLPAVPDRGDRRGAGRREVRSAWSIARCRFGWNCGPLYQDVAGALGRAGKQMPSMSFIGGLAGADLTTEHFGAVIERVAQLAGDGRAGPTVWLNEND